MSWKLAITVGSLVVVVGGCLYLFRRQEDAGVVLGREWVRAIDKQREDCHPVTHSDGKTTTVTIECHWVTLQTWARRGGGDVPPVWPDVPPLPSGFFSSSLRYRNRAESLVTIRGQQGCSTWEAGGFYDAMRKGTEWRFAYRLGFGIVEAAPLGVEKSASW